MVRVSTRFPHRATPRGSIRSDLAALSFCRAFVSALTFSCSAMISRSMSSTSLNVSNSIILSNTVRISTRIASMLARAAVLVGADAAGSASCADSFLSCSSSPGKRSLTIRRSGSATPSFKRIFNSSVSTRLLIISARISSKASATPSVSCRLRSTFCTTRATCTAWGDAAGSAPAAGGAAALAGSAASVPASRLRVSVNSSTIVSKRRRSRSSRASSIARSCSGVTTSST